MELNDITYKINSAIFEVNKLLGPGFLEKVYERALLLELKKMGLMVKNQAPINVDYKGESVGEYIADLFVENRVIVEIKTVDKLSKAHEAQLLNYLKATNTQIGILVNFNKTRADIKRMVYNLED